MKKNKAVKNIINVFNVIIILITFVFVDFDDAISKIKELGLMDFLLSHWNHIIVAMLIFIGLYVNIHYIGKYVKYKVQEINEEEFDNLKQNIHEEFDNLKQNIHEEFDNLKQNIHEELEKINKNHGNINEVVKIVAIFSAITNKLVRDYILANTSKKSLKDYLHDNKFYIDELRRYGIPEEIITEIQLKSIKEEEKYIKEKKKKLKEEKNEHNTDIGKVPE